MPLAVTGLVTCWNLRDEVHVLGAFALGNVVGLLQQQVADEVVDRNRAVGVPPLGLADRLLDEGAIALAHLRLAVVHVGAVDGKAGDDLAHRLVQAVEREVAIVPVPLREAVQPVGQHVQLAGHADAQDELLAAIGDLAEGHAQAGEALVHLVHRALVALIDEQAVQHHEEVVAARALHRPLRQRSRRRRESSRPRRRADGRACSTSGRTSRARACRRSR